MHRRSAARSDILLRDGRRRLRRDNAIHVTAHATDKHNRDRRMKQSSAWFGGQKEVEAKEDEAGRNKKKRGRPQAANNQQRSLKRDRVRLY